MIKKAHHVIESENGDLCIGEIPNHSKLIKTPPQWVSVVLEKLDGAHTIPRIVKEVKAQKLDVDETNVSDFIRQLSEFGLLEDSANYSDTLTAKELERYDRQLLQFSLFDNKRQPGFEYQEKLKKSRVTILGMGGWGTWCALQLSLIGIGTLRVVDGDDVELSNLNRQVLYGDNNVGEQKVDAARQRIKLINPNVNVEIFDEFVTREEDQIEKLLNGSDLVILAWASLGYYRKNTIEEVVHRYAEEHNISVMELGGDPVDISVGPLYSYDGTHPPYHQLKKSQIKEYYSENESIREIQKSRMLQKFRNGRRTVNAWQSAPSLSTMSGLVCDQVIKSLTEYDSPTLLGKRFHMSLSTFETRIEKLF